MRPLRSRLTLLLLPLLLLGLQACTEPQAPPIRLGTNLWPGYEPLYLAQQLRLIDPAQVRLIEYPSASDVIRAFRNRTLDAAALTLDEALLLQHDGIPVSVILVTDISNGGDVIMAREAITSFAALKGKRVAVESAALGAYVISRALEIHGMSLADIVVEHLAVSAHEEAYRRGWVDAVVTFEPVRTQLRNLGAHEIFSSREIPGEIVDVIVVHNALLEQQSGRLRALINGWFSALEQLQQQPANAAALTAKRLNLSPGEVLESYVGLELPSREENRRLLATAGPLQATLSRLSTMMVNSGLLRQQESTTALITDRMVN